MSSTESAENGFAELGLSEPLLQAIADTGYTTPTPIQHQAIPLVLEGGDLLAAAQTGTGKTAGFTLPVLDRLHAAKREKRGGGVPLCLIVTPTRELAAQIAEAVDTYGKNVPLRSTVIFGGVNVNRHIKEMQKPVDILIATPGRLLDLVSQKVLDLSKIEILVLDEADRMLDMGFIHDVKRILKIVPKQRQTLLFSATFSDDIRSLAKTLLKNPAEVSVARRNTASELVDQSVYLVDKTGKRALLSLLIKEHQWPQVLVFTRTKHGANRLAEQLKKEGIKSDAIHGNKSQGARTRALSAFKDGSLPVLVATDIAARGLDIEQLPNVVNYELPNVPEDYVHRIGRTGRAGSSGQAVSLVEADELKLLKGIEKLIKRDIPRVDVEGHTGHTKQANESGPSDQRNRGSGRRRGGPGNGSGRGRGPQNTANRSGRAPGGNSRRTARGRG